MKSGVRKLVPNWALSSYHWLLAATGSLIYGFPAEKLIVIGVTGTDGKTTTSNLIAQLLEATGNKVGLTSTTTFKIGKKEWANNTKQGMQGRFKNQQLLHKTVKAGCKYAVIETTSEGIKQFRHVGINYDVAVFTNLTPEHIESHGSFENYKQAKGQLFSRVAKSCKLNSKKWAVVNADDKHAKYFLNFGCEHKMIFGLDEGKSDLPRVSANNIELDNKGTKFVLRSHLRQGFGGQVKNQEHKVCTKLVGKFNVYNILAAISVALSQDISLNEIIEALPKLKSVPGRMEIIDEGQDFTVIVDYAHAPNALETVYKTVKPFLKGELWSLLGSQGGGRDKQKRPILGKLAGQYADKVVVTNEDPYDDDPQEIIDEVFAGVVGAGKRKEENAWKILDRREAISFVLKHAQPGDTVLLTGKGHEQVMIGKDGERIKWDDRDAVREIMRNE